MFQKPTFDIEKGSCEHDKVDSDALTQDVEGPSRFLPEEGGYSLASHVKKQKGQQRVKKASMTKPTDKRGVYWKMPGQLLQRTPWPWDPSTNEGKELVRAQFVHSQSGALRCVCQRICRRENQYPGLGKEGSRMTN
jgi:hypothetical protein